MLRISKDQLYQFQAQSADSFVFRVVAFLKSQFSEYGSVADVKMKSAVEPMIERSIAYGLETEQEIIVFVLAAHYLGNNFDIEISEARRSLSDSEKSSVWKTAWLEALIFEVSGRRAEYAS